MLTMKLSATLTFVWGKAFDHLAGFIIDLVARLDRRNIYSCYGLPIAPPSAPEIWWAGFFMPLQLEFSALVKLKKQSTIFCHSVLSQEICIRIMIQLPTSEKLFCRKLKVFLSSNCWSHTRLVSSTWVILVLMDQKSRPTLQKAKPWAIKDFLKSNSITPESWWTAVVRSTCWPWWETAWRFDNRWKHWKETRGFG